MIDYFLNSGSRAYYLYMSFRSHTQFNSLFLFCLHHHCLDRCYFPFRHNCIFRHLYLPFHLIIHFFQFQLVLEARVIYEFNALYLLLLLFLILKWWNDTDNDCWFLITSFCSLHLANIHLFFHPPNILQPLWFTNFTLSLRLTYYSWK